MKNVSLKSHLKKISKNFQSKAAIITENNVLTYKDLTLPIWTVDGDNVLICCESIINTISAIISLDGIANCFCAVNPSLNDNDLFSIINQYKFTHIISDLPKEQILKFETLKLNTVHPSKLFTKCSRGVVKKNFKTTWLIPTSGTSSTPKLVMHDFQTLSAKYNSRNQTNDSNVWGLFYDITRYAGYQVFFKTILEGGTLVIPNLNYTIKKKIDICVKNNVSHISATPTLFRKIMMSPGFEKLKLSQIVIGGEAADQQILNGLKRSFPNAKITHVYASTETGVGFSVSDCKAGYPIKFYNCNKKNVEIDIRGERLFVKSSLSGKAYVNNKKLLDKDGWVDTGDIVKVEKNRFHIIGRANGSINVAGDKVFPEQIRNKLLENEDIEDVVVYGKKNPFSGTFLMADVQLKKLVDQNIAKKNLKNFLDTNFLPNQKPKIIRYVKEISVSLAGKVVKNDIK